MGGSSIEQRRHAAVPTTACGTAVDRGHRRPSHAGRLGGPTNTTGLTGAPAPGGSTRRRHKEAPQGCTDSHAHVPMGRSTDLCTVCVCAQSDCSLPTAACPRHGSLLAANGETALAGAESNSESARRGVPRRVHAPPRARWRQHGAAHRGGRVVHHRLVHRVPQVREELVHRLRRLHIPPVDVSAPWHNQQIPDLWDMLAACRPNQTVTRTPTHIIHQGSPRPLPLHPWLAMQTRSFGDRGEADGSARELSLRIRLACTSFSGCRRLSPLSGCRHRSRPAAEGGLHAWEGGGVLGTHLTCGRSGVCHKGLPPFRRGGHEL